MGVAFSIPIRRCMHMLLPAMLFVWGAALFFLTRAEVECDAPAVLIPAILDGNTGYVPPRPYHAVQAYLIGCGLNRGSMGILVESHTVWMVVLIAFWSQKHQIFGQHVVKTPQNEALSRSGNKCLLRRFEACPTYLILIINAMLLISIDLFLKIR